MCMREERDVRRLETKERAKAERQLWEGRVSWSAAVLSVRDWTVFGRCIEGRHSSPYLHMRTPRLLSGLG